MHGKNQTLTSHQKSAWKDTHEVSCKYKWEEKRVFISSTGFLGTLTQRMLKAPFMNYNDPTCLYTFWVVSLIMSNVLPKYSSIFYLWNVTFSLLSPGNLLRKIILLQSTGKWRCSTRGSEGWLLRLHTNTSSLVIKSRHDTEKNK